MHEFEDIPARTEAEADFQRALTRFRHARYIPTPASTVLTPAETHVIMGIGHFADADQARPLRVAGHALTLEQRLDILLDGDVVNDENELHGDCGYACLGLSTKE